MTEIDWSEVDDEIIRHVRANADMHQKAQLDVLLASDRRALTLAQLSVTVASAAIAAWLALRPAIPLSAVIVFVLMTSIAATIASLSAFRGLFRYPGNPPSSWFDQELLNSAWRSAVGADIEVSQRSIDANDLTIIFCRRLQVFAAALVIVAPAASGLAAWAAARL